MCLIFQNSKRFGAIFFLKQARKQIEPACKQGFLIKLRFRQLLRTFQIHGGNLKVSANETQ